MLDDRNTASRRLTRNWPCRAPAWRSVRAGILAWVAVLAGCLSPPNPRLPQIAAQWQPAGSAAIVRGANPDGSDPGQGVLDLTPVDITSEQEPPALGGRPRTLREEDVRPESCRDLTLDEAIYHALTRTRTLRELGGLVLTNPDGVETKYDPSIVEADPRTGVEAALSEFDARFAASGSFEKNDRAFNNIFFGGGTRLFQQDLHVWQTQISKTAATGTQFFVRNFTDYNANNAPGNQFGSAWNSNVEMEFRHPLLQGGGVEFNRIAGPRSGPGASNGVLIARANSRISQAEFETGLRDFLSNVTNAYWDLYFAYRDHDVKQRIRDQAYHLAAIIESNEGKKSVDRIALVKEQQFRFQEEVWNSLSGKQVEGTRTNNGAPGGSLRGTGGILVAERRLRLLIGWPITDEALIRPADEPCESEVVFDYQQLVSQSLSCRPELKRQRVRVERREMELRATRNFLYPQLDATGRYRWRGFGRDLAGDSADGGEFSSAWSNLVGGDFQEWQLGFELDIPLGFRRAHAALHQAELNLAREKTILFEQERQIVHDLSNSLAEFDRAFIVCQTASQRWQQTQILVDALESGRERSQRTLEKLDQILDAQRRHADSESRYFLARTELEVAVKNVFYEAGTLPQYLRVATLGLDSDRGPDRRGLAHGLVQRALPIVPAGSQTPPRPVEPTAALTPAAASAGESSDSEDVAPRQGAERIVGVGAVGNLAPEPGDDVLQLERVSAPSFEPPRTDEFDMQPPGDWEEADGWINDSGEPRGNGSGGRAETRED